MRGQRYSGASSRHGGLTRTKDGQIAAMRGAGQPRGAAAGAAWNWSRHTTYEPYTTHPHAPDTRKRGAARRRFDSASRSYVTASEVHTDSNHSTTMARSLGSSMARGLGILLIMMTLSEIAATRARPAYHNKGLLPPHRDGTARAGPLSKRAPLAAAGDHGNERGQRRRGARDSRDAPTNRTNAQAPSSTRTTGPFTSSRRASVPSSRRSASALMMSPTPTRRLSARKQLR